MKDCGILYFLTAKKEDEEGVLNTHKDLLIRSVKSLKKLMRDMPTALYTNIDGIDWKSYGFDIVNYKYGPDDIWTYKYECLIDSPFPRTIHMDCDTYVCKKFYEVFRMLDEIDIAAPFSPWYMIGGIHEVPASFPELAGGFMAYNATHKVRELFRYVRELVIDRQWGCDEPWLRKALYEMDIKFSVLPWEYNCVFLLPGFLVSSARVLHGKYEDIESVEKIMAPRNPKFYTGETVIQCEKLGRRKYKVGSVEKCGYDN